MGSLPHLSPGPSASDLCAASGWPQLCCPPARLSGRLSQAHSLAQVDGLGRQGGWSCPRRRENRTLLPPLQAKTFQPHPVPLPVIALPALWCACLLRTHSGPSHRQPEPQASVPAFQHFGGPLPLSWVLGTLLGTRPTWSLVPAPWLRFDR